MYVVTTNTPFFCEKRAVFIETRPFVKMSAVVRCPLAQKKKNAGLPGLLSCFAKNFGFFFTTNFGQKNTKRNKDKDRISVKLQTPLQETGTSRHFVNKRGKRTVYKASYAQSP